MGGIKPTPISNNCLKVGLPVLKMYIEMGNHHVFWKEKKISSLCLQKFMVCKEEIYTQLFLRKTVYH